MRIFKNLKNPGIHENRKFLLKKKMDMEPIVFVLGLRLVKGYLQWPCPKMTTEPKEAFYHL